MCTGTGSDVAWGAAQGYTHTTLQRPWNGFASSSGGIIIRDFAFEKSKVYQLFFSLTGKGLRQLSDVGRHVILSLSDSDLIASLLSSGLSSNKPLWLHGEHFAGRKNQFLWEEGFRVPALCSYDWNEWQCFYFRCRFLVLPFLGWKTCQTNSSVTTACSQNFNFLQWRWSDLEIFLQHIVFDEVFI